MLVRSWLTALLFGLLAVSVSWADPPLKALIVDGQNAHNWKETSPVLKTLLEDSGMFQVDVATSPPKGQDMSGFQPDFSKYALVVLNYQGDEWAADTKQAFVDYVKNGGGVLVYHFACAAFPKWPEYNEIIGLGGWGGRNETAGPYLRLRDGQFVRDETPGRGGGHGPMQPFQLIVREPNHPITQGLPPTFMHVDDELYGWLRGPAKNLTVLATAFAPKELGGAGEHEPVLFTVEYGKGRVFQNALGHTAKELKSVAFIATFLRGAEWAATGKVTQSVPDDFPGPDKASIRE
ncbi:MAG: ThuA domain-containing protein [Pirellulaceae bacterium]|nr:ThuA domain-containing protein [Pirellulaceae bacterium]